MYMQIYISKPKWSFALVQDLPTSAFAIKFLGIDACVDSHQEYSSITIWYCHFRTNQLWLYDRDTMQLIVVYSVGNTCLDIDGKIEGIPNH